MVNWSSLRANALKAARDAGPIEAHAILSRLMCRALDSIRDLLPEEGERALNEALAFWMDGMGGAASLTATRVSCWKYLDQKPGGSSAIPDDGAAAMRAVICVLFPEPQRDDFSMDTLEFFAEMFDRMGRDIAA